MELLLPLLILLLLVPMILSVRRQKREMERTAQMQDALRVGDRVMTTSGLYGDIVGLGDTTLDIELAPGVVTTWARMAVREVVADEPDADELDSDGLGSDDHDLDAQDAPGTDGSEDRPGPRDGGPTLGKN